MRRYGDALGDAFLFFEAQHSGDVDSNVGGNRIRWRGQQLMEDGADIGKDLSGGMYEAGSALFSDPPPAANLSSPRIATSSTAWCIAHCAVSLCGLLCVPDCSHQHPNVHCESSEHLLLLSHSTDRGSCSIYETSLNIIEASLMTRHFPLYNILKLCHV